MSKSLNGAVYTKDQLFREVKACGSHFFDANTRRFFNSRVLGVYPAPSKKATYFAEAVGGGRTPVSRSYRVGVFKNCKVQALGKGSSGLSKGYASSAKAKKVASQIAAKAEGYPTAKALKMRAKAAKAAARKR